MDTTPAEAVKTFNELFGEVYEQIIGQEEVIEQVLCAFLSSGHVLLTGVPGLAKTRLVRVFARCLGLSFGRIQYTPDLLPSDITGSEILQYDQSKGRRTFEFIKGPIFHHLVLADEINRASPRTQAAMLEAMQERGVTYGGTRYLLPQPFMVCATQNPIESEGTFPLPEAQLDRFFIHVLVNYPSQQEELAILQGHHNHKLKEVDDGVRKPEEVSIERVDFLQKILEYVRNMTVDRVIFELVNELVRNSRLPFETLAEVKPSGFDERMHQVRYGAGPRGSLCLIAAAKAKAFLQGDKEVRWRHVKALACPVLRHRIGLKSSYLRHLGGHLSGVDAFINAHIDVIEKKHRLLDKMH
ncbi:MAG: AAA family ATPase [Proteobacteria bacterium]|nr:AAA family ATPase [Pseudomonadota bacterium]